MFWPCETRTSTCRSFATISSGLYRFLAIAVLLDVEDIPQVGPLQWGWITSRTRIVGRRIATGSSEGNLLRAASRPYVDNTTLGTLFRGSGYFSAWERPPCIFLLFSTQIAAFNASCECPNVPSLSRPSGGRARIPDRSAQAVISAEEHRHQRVG